MNRIYFDNAATTSLEPQVLEIMMPYWQPFFYLFLWTGNQDGD